MRLPLLLALLGALSSCSLINDFDSLPVPGSSDAGTTGDAGRPDGGPPAELDCDDGLDDNANGLYDCWDPSCEGRACAGGGQCDPALGCVGGESNCRDGMDEDDDGQYDCSDADCLGQACAGGGLCDAQGCGGGESVCDDSADDDLDGATDCDDPDCAAWCKPKEICDNGGDDDGDGFIDCVDPDCDASSCLNSGRCVQGSCVLEWDCDDALDDNSDGLTDCQDVTFCGSKTCFGGGLCKAGGCEGGESGLCGDLKDNDGDGLADCGDPDCGCGSPEVCDNAKDDDIDTLTDCADPECAGKLCAAGRVCHAWSCAMACAPGATTLGPDDGPGTCSYGERCDQLACVTDGFPSTACFGAQGAPGWDVFHQGPVIVGVAAFTFTGTGVGESTWCATSNGGFYVDIEFYAPNGLKTASWYERASQVRFLTPAGAAVGAAIAENFPPDGKIGTLRTGVCAATAGLSFAGYAVQLVDSTGVSGNAACL